MSALANWYPGHSVLDFCVIAATTVILVTATAWMVSLFLKRHPAIRHWVLLSALVASLASPFLALGFIASGRSFINVTLLIAEDTALAPELPDKGNPSRNRQALHGHARSLDEPAPSVTPETLLPTHRTGPAKAEAVRDKVATAEPRSPTVHPATGPADPFRSAVAAILLMWLCGTLVVILGLLRGVLFMRRLRRSARPMTDAELCNALDEARRLVGARSSPAIGVSSLARSPMVAGLFRPIIVIPRNLLGAIRGQELRDILMHEIAHVERRDNLVVLLQAIAKTAFWPIPFMHLLNRELDRAREEICDNHVLACRDAVSYGETLLRVAHLAFETKMPVGTVGILHWRGKLEDRILGLIHKRRSKMTRMHPLIALAVLALFLSASAILCGTTIIAAQPPQTATAGDDRVTKSSDEDSRKAQDKRDRPPAAAAAEAVFRIPAEQVRAAKELAAAHRAQRGDRKSRRPAGLEDLDSPASIQRAIEQSIEGLAGKGPESVSLTELMYLGDAAFDALVQGANSEDSNVAKWCCVVLPHRGQKAVAPLCAVLASKAPSFVRSTAALSLGNTFDPDGVPALIAALDDKDVRVSAMLALMYPRDPRAIEPLRRLEKIPGIGHAATQSIEHIQSPQGYAWWPPESRKLRQVCEDARTLKGERYGQAEIDQLVTGLKLKQFNIADRCLYALGDLDAREAVPAMIALPLSQARIHALSQIGTTGAVDCIIDELHSLNSQTRELTLDGMSSGADRWAAPLIIALLDDDSLKVAVKGKEDGFSIRAADPSDNWPEYHKAHQALFMYLGRFGLQGEWRNRHRGETNNVPKEIKRLKEWWAQHGADFVAGKSVPNPNLTTVWYNDP